MATPYLRRGITLADRAVTTTGADYVTGALRYNDFLDADWIERTGATAFTGAFYHQVLFTYGYTTSKPLSYDNPANIVQHSSGYRTSTATRYARQSFQLSFQAASVDEAAEFERFCLLCQGSNQIIEWVDEGSRTLPVRIDSFSMTKNPSSDAALPYNLSISLSCELATDTVVSAGSVGTI